MSLFHQYKEKIIIFPLLELDALGDEMFMDDDSYLDDAISAPAVPGTDPGVADTSEPSRTKVILNGRLFIRAMK